MPGVWISAPTTSLTKTTVSGLAPSVSYDFQVIVINALGSVVSAPITVQTATAPANDPFSTDYSAAFGGSAALTRMFRFLFRGRKA